MASLKVGNPTLGPISPRGLIAKPAVTMARARAGSHFVTPNGRQILWHHARGREVGVLGGVCVKFFTRGITHAGANLGTNGTQTNQRVPPHTRPHELEEKQPDNKLSDCSWQHARPHGAGRLEWDQLVPNSQGPAHAPARSGSLIRQLTDL